LDKILGIAPSIQNTIKIPLLKYDQINSFFHGIMPEKEMHYLDYITNCEGLFAITGTKSYEPYIKSGSLLIVDTNKKFEDGEVVLVKDKEQFSIKEYIVDGRNKYLKSIITSQLEPLDNVKNITGVVVEIRQNLTIA
jgi:SOS-response transcriptional repressor LexA